jgi:cytochrome c oxidase cbb3-type subunit 3
MSDFFNVGWSIYIGSIVLLGLAGCLLLLVMAARRRVVSTDNTTGHVWDEDLRELNNPLPRWWMYLFVITIVFALAYLTLFPGLGSHRGALGWSSVGQYQDETAKARASTGPLYASYMAQPIPQLAHDPKAMATGERLFSVNCAPCHGADAHGSKGFPNLTDRDWLHGGAPEQIVETITNGRVGMMPVMAPAVGTAADIHNVANYVLSLSGSPHDPIAAAQGQAKFVVCAACHGADGKGNIVIGSANLTDRIWLHGYGEAAITAMVTQGKVNIMPAQKERLSPEQIHVLAAYVWGFSNGGADAVPQPGDRETTVGAMATK